MNIIFTRLFVAQTKPSSILNLYYHTIKYNTPILSNIVMFAEISAKTGCLSRENCDYKGGGDVCSCDECDSTSECELL